jgi:hypothetical protein
MKILNKEVLSIAKICIVVTETKNIITETPEIFNNIKFVDKIAYFTESIKANEAFKLLETAKISKNKLTYFFMDRNNESLQIVKYNPKEGKNLKDFMLELFGYYYKHNIISEKVEISGGNEFVVINNLSQQSKNIVKRDIIKMLSK